MSRTKKFDLISIGDSTHDTFVRLDEASIHCNKNTKKCVICFSWADKIPVKEIAQVPGVGNSANAAVGAARLGLKTAIRTHVGDDIVGKSIQDNFKNEGVARDYIKVYENRPSNYSVVINYGAERTILVHHERWKYDLPKDLNTSWFYFSSLGPDHKKIHKQIVNYVKKKGVKLAFQPGTYQLREGKKNLKDILKHTEIITLNKEEAQLLASTTARDPKKIMLDLNRLGPRIVVMTDGPKGAYACDGDHAYFVDIFPMDAKERTGAGDSFSIGFVGALAKGRSITEALLWGNANSTSVVQYVGAQKGLLDEKGIIKYMKKFRRIKPRTI